MFNLVTKNIARPHLIEALWYDAAPIEQVHPSMDALLHNLKGILDGYLE